MIAVCPNASAPREIGNAAGFLPAFRAIELLSRVTRLGFERQQGSSVRGGRLVEAAHDLPSEAGAACVGMDQDGPHDGVVPLVLGHCQIEHAGCQQHAVPPGRDQGAFAGAGIGGHLVPEGPRLVRRQWRQEIHRRAGIDAGDKDVGQAGFGCGCRGDVEQGHTVNRLGVTKL
jgi:hypothetical protein